MAGVYRVAFRIEGAPMFPSNTNWISREFAWLPGAPSRVQLVEEEQDDEAGLSVHKAIRFVFDLTTDTPQEALGIAELAADSVARIIGFQAGSPYVAPRVIAMLNVTPGIRRREYRQWCYDLIATKPTRPILVPDVEITAHSLQSRDLREREAVLRGMKWYTDALFERDPMDRFLNAWIGLECIGLAIDSRVHARGWQSCQICRGELQHRGELRQRKKDSKSERGVRHMLSVVQPNDVGLYERLVVARHKLVHGDWTLDRVRQLVGADTDAPVVALVRGVLTVVAPPGVEAGSRQALVPTPQIRRGADVSVSLDVLSDDPDVLGQLIDLLYVNVQVRSSSFQEDLYRVDAAIEVHGSFAAPVEGMTVQSEREDELIFEMGSEPEFRSYEVVLPDGRRVPLEKEEPESGGAREVTTS